MPALSPSETAAFRERLRARDVELRRTIHAALMNSDDKTYAEVAGRVLDAGEASVADFMADAKIIEIEKEVAEQAEVIAALARVTNGSYGQCVDCGDDVGAKRLDAELTARRCIRCQTHYERTHRGRTNGTPSL